MTPPMSPDEIEEAIVLLGKIGNLNTKSIENLIERIKLLEDQVTLLSKQQPPEGPRINLN